MGKIEISDDLRNKLDKVLSYKSVDIGDTAVGPAPSWKPPRPPARPPALPQLPPQLPPPQQPQRRRRRTVSRSPPEAARPCSRRSWPATTPRMCRRRSSRTSTAGRHRCGCGCRSAPRR